MPVQTETVGAIAAAVSPMLKTLTPSSGQTRLYTVELLCRHYQHWGTSICTKSYQKFPKYFPCYSSVQPHFSSLLEKVKPCGRSSLGWPLASL